uniref:Uncharacterized protein n=1 Tax=Moorena producens (strain JHB) TaxID=1454205 RepID=A0A1D9FZT4_MOOP1
MFAIKRELKLNNFQAGFFAGCAGVSIQISALSSRVGKYQANHHLIWNYVICPPYNNYRCKHSDISSQ